MVKFWFVRTDGNTPLNNPNSLDYVPEERNPPYPQIRYKYLQKCLNEGFARIGWPNTGDLTLLGSNPPRLAPLGYSYESIEPEYRRYLNQFRTIKAGDFILSPGEGDGGEECMVHIGIVLTKDRKIIKPYIEPRPDAYFYYYDFSKEDWYECAHRVNVQWAKLEGEYPYFKIQETGFPVWIKAFSPLNDKNGTIYQTAKKAGLF